MDVRKLTLKQLLVLRKRIRTASIRADREGDDALWAKLCKENDTIEPAFPK